MAPIKTPTDGSRYHKPSYAIGSGVTGECTKFCLLAPPNDHRSLRSPVTRRLKFDTFKRCGGRGEGGFLTRRATRSLEREHDRPGYWISKSKPTAQVFQRIAKRVERRDHVWPRRGQRVHIGPLSYDAIGPVTCFDDVDVLEACPISLDLLMPVEKRLLSPWLHPGSVLR